jgi:hypothetical protein
MPKKLACKKPGNVMLATTDDVLVTALIPQNG